MFGFYKTKNQSPRLTHSTPFTAKFPFPNPRRSAVASQAKLEPEPEAELEPEQPTNVTTTSSIKHYGEQTTTYKKENFLPFNRRKVPPALATISEVPEFMPTPEIGINTD